MTIQYTNGVTADCPVIKAIEAEMYRLDELADNWLFNGLTPDEHTMLVARRDTLLKVYKQFTEPYEILFLYAEQESNCTLCNTHKGME